MLKSDDVGTSKLSEHRSSNTTTGSTVSEKAVKCKFKKVDESKVHYFIDRVRQGLNCSFCGGTKCKHENWNSLGKKRVGTAFEGLISNWIGSDVVASQRPSTSLFAKYSLIQQFKTKQITGVFNLQEKGEHAKCGPDGIYADTGYSYNGEADLMRHNISYYEFPWPDMTAPQQDIVLRSVQVMDSHVKNSGKVLVHCHAGLGRTGLMIACFLVYSWHMPSADAIQMVRQMRPGAIQTSKQARFISDFERHLLRLAQVFRMELTDPVIDVEIFLQRQRLVLHGEQADSYRYVPMPIHLLLCRLVNLTIGGADVDSVLCSFACGDSPDESTLSSCRLSINRRRFNVDAITDIHILIFLVCDWFRSMSLPPLTVEVCDSLIEFKRKRPCERELLPNVIPGVISKSVRHTLGMVLSAFHVISTNAKASTKNLAFKRLVDSFSHANDPLKLRYSPTEREMIYDFFFEWSDSVQDLYFNANAVSVEHRTIRGIALASSVALEDASHRHFKNRSLTLCPADDVAQSAEERR